MGQYGRPNLALAALLVNEVNYKKFSKYYKNNKNYKPFSMKLPFNSYNLIRQKSPLNSEHDNVAIS